MKQVSYSYSSRIDEQIRRNTGFNSYQQYLSSSVWRAKRKKKLKKAKHQCENCFSTYDLVIHHKTYERVGKELLDDLQVLCSKCHLELHFSNDKSLTKPDEFAEEQKLKAHVKERRKEIEKYRNKNRL